MAEPHENTPELPQLSKSQAQNPGPGLRTTTEWHCSLSLGLKDGSSGEAKPSLGDSGRPGRTPTDQRPGTAARGHASPGVPRGHQLRGRPPGPTNPRGTGTSVGIPGPFRGRPLLGLLARACSPAPPYLAFSSASTARRSTVLKRLFMATGRVATAVLSAADPTPGRLAPAHARSARRYGSPHDPIFLEAIVRPVTETFCEIRVSSGFFSLYQNNSK